MNLDFLNMKKLKRNILILSIGIIAIVIMMIIILAGQKEQEVIEEYGNEEGDYENYHYDKEIVTDHSTFFSIANCVQEYLNSISLKVEDISSTPVRGSKMRSAATIYAENQDITDETSKREAIYNFLDSTYIEKNKITKENILNKIGKQEEVLLTPLKMYQVPSSKGTAQYALYGKTKPIEEGEEKEVYFVISVDKNNNTFSITPIDNNSYEDVKDIPIAEGKTIEKNDNNSYSYRIMQDNEVAQKYFTYYKKLMEADATAAYELLDEEYRNKRFGGLEAFKAYMEKNQEEIEGYLAQEYELNQKKDKTEYICKDQYQHYYIFEVEGVMQFSVKLDNYTIEEEEVKQEYQQAKETRKVEMNIDKWIIMLNHRDYKAAYEVLDEEFRANYFPSVEEFEDYMRTTFPIYYGLTFSDYSKEAGVCIQDILLTDIRAEEKMVLHETILMKLTDDGFRMSFRILS